MTGLHISWGAYEVNLAASIAALSFALLWFVAWLRVSRCGYMLLLAGGWLLLCVYWGLIAISAGANPVLARGDIARIVREVLLAAMLLLALGKAAMIWAALRLHR